MAALSQTGEAECILQCILYGLLGIACSFTQGIRIEWAVGTKQTAARMDIEVKE